MIGVRFARWLLLLGFSRHVLVSLISQGLGIAKLQIQFQKPPFLIKHYRDEPLCTNCPSTPWQRTEHSRPSHQGLLGNLHGVDMLDFRYLYGLDQDICELGCVPSAKMG